VWGEDFNNAGKTSKGNPDAMNRKAVADLPVFAGGSAAQTGSFFVGQEQTAMPCDAGDVMEWQ
jgi:hypothetical protein